MEWLSEFMEWSEYDKWSRSQIENPPYGIDAWGVWMTEVEPRIRERGLWDDYLSELMRDSNVWEADLKQRAEALRRVLE